MNKTLKLLLPILFLLMAKINQAQNVVASMYLLDSTTLRFKIHFDNNLILHVTNIPAIDVNGNTIWGTFNATYTSLYVDMPLYSDTTLFIGSALQTDAGNNYTDAAYFVLKIDSNKNIHFANFSNLNETTVDFNVNPTLQPEIINEQMVTNIIMNSGVYTGTISNVSDLSDTLQTLINNNGIVNIQCTDGTMITAGTSGYNNALNTINFSANIPGGKTVARVLASHAWIDVPDVLSEFALPIDIISFEGKAVQNEYHLALKVAKELNVKHYELQKSIDGLTYETIEILFANNSIIYNFIDRNPSQINFYRIKVVDIDEHIMHSKVLNYSKTNIDIVKMYPNPTTNILTIELPQRKTNQTIYIKNLFGQIVYKQEILDKQFETINTESLSKGNYILQVVSTSQTLTTKFSKE